MKNTARVHRNGGTTSHASQGQTRPATLPRPRAQVPPIDPEFSLPPDAESNANLAQLVLSAQAAANEATAATDTLGQESFKLAKFSESGFDRADYSTWSNAFNAQLEMYRAFSQQDSPATAAAKKGCGPNPTQNLSAPKIANAAQQRQSVQDMRAAAEEMNQAAVQAITLLTVASEHAAERALNGEYSEKVEEAFAFGFDLLQLHVQEELLKQSDNVMDVAYQKLPHPTDAIQNGAAMARKAGAAA